MPQNFLQLFHCLIVFILRSHINFSKNDEERYFQEEAETNVLLSHFLQAHICTNNNTSEIWRKSSKSIDSSFQVFFVTTKIN